MAEKTFNLYFNTGENPRPVGKLSVSETDTSTPKLFFAYDAAWLEEGFSLGADLPLEARVFATDRLNPLFGFLYDLLPGLTARKCMKRVHQKDLPIIDLALQAQETLRPGALEFGQGSQPLVQSKALGPVVLDLERLILGHLNISDIDSLYKATEGLPGERFKLSFISSKNRIAISKFNIPDPLRNLVRWEAIALELGRRLGLKTVDATVGTIRGMEALVSVRFDRTADGKKIGFASAQSLLAAKPESEHSWAEVADILNKEGASPTKDLKELWSRMVFYMTIGNTNDALSNIGFLRDAWGWRLAPMYGLTPAPVSVTRRHHATAVTPDCDRPSLQKAVEIAPYFGLTKKKAEAEALRIASFVHQNWEKVAREARADPLEIDNMRKAFELLEL